MFDAAGLAKKAGIPVVYDFRSDDIFNGGEGAPLAPVHNLHLSYALSRRGMFPVCFINGGNTANLALVSSGATLRKKVCGYDCGPFNHYADMLAKAFYGADFDEDGKLAAGGHINSMLLKDLYDEAAVTADGDNFLDIVPPKSSGPHLYRMAERLKNYPLAEQDILRTVEYFAAYTVFMGLRFLPKELDFPRYFLMFGGGWRNPLIYRDFISLLTGRGLLFARTYRGGGKYPQEISRRKVLCGDAGRLRHQRTIYGGADYGRYGAVFSGREKVYRAGNYRLPQRRSVRDSLQTGREYPAARTGLYLFTGGKRLAKSSET